ncbi:acetylxylan esterase [Sinomicrobium weinanense]|uniref:Acetylxylan esterase n=1 Tax=Sinomicrobium weinanense TaxID=2842200 RepID=A0A926JQL3_9FLAO|nr:acetylxylan esterase [Sinomicrobium weinanense]MBC9795677.1 acetylxylan esterase [Sinomicrobium weinanense]MBU3122846.1 acetylxylan esterase [Sinomicrobium weinanense]
MLNLQLKNSFICLFFLLSFFGHAQNLRLQKGTVTDSVPIPGTDLLHYAIYLPEAYTAEKKWPVIFVFDTEKRNREAVEAFTAAPGGRQYIIVGGNSVKNTSYEANFYLAKRLFDIVLEKFPVDPKRIYTAGFSAGGRLATAIGAISKDVDGVIACGAALPGNEKYMPRKNDFLFVGLVGDEDGSYREMKGTVSSFNGKKFHADLLVYEGASHYPPAEYVDKALRTLTVKSIAKGALPGSERKIDSLYLKDMDFNRKQEKEGRVFYAFEDLKQLTTNYSSYKDKDGFKQRRKEIRKNNEFRKQRNDSYGISELENYYMVDYLTFLGEDISAGNIGQLPSWEEEIIALEKLEKGKNQAKAKMARRLKNMLKSVVLETIPSLDEEKDIDKLLFVNAFVVLLDPEQEEAYFNILKYSVEKSEYGMALFYLEKLLQTGFKDVKKLNEDEDISLLRIQPEYNDILRDYGLKALY